MSGDDGGSPLMPLSGGEAVAMAARAGLRPNPRPPVGRRRVASDRLFQGERELLIVHGDKDYVLRITRQGKLILTT